MTSFLGIAESGQTSLGIVAPGIAQALVATAAGLFAASPRCSSTTTSRAE